MRRGLSLATSVLVACGFNPSPAGTAVDAGITPTADATIDAPGATPDAPPPTPGDSDGDGILDNVDNCPHVPNPQQYDEDHDGIGDACDGCPQIGPNGSDTDGDGLPNACDPHPTIGSDVQLVFDPLRVGSGTDGLPVGWRLVDSSASDFTMSDGDLVLDATADDDLALAEAPTGNATHAFDASFTITDGTADDAVFEIIANATSSDSGDTACGIAFGDSPMVQLYSENLDGSTSPVTQAITAPSATGVVRIQLVIDPTVQTCTITLPTGAPITLRDQLSAMGGEHVGLRGTDVAMHVHSITTYCERGSACLPPATPPL